MICGWSSKHQKGFLIFINFYKYGVVMEGIKENNIEIWTNNQLYILLFFSHNSKV